MKTTRILKSETFSYPTKEERREINKEIPKITRLKFDYKSAFINYLETNDIHNSINQEDIYWWNLCLSNRFGKLEKTFLYVITHYKRFNKFEIEENEAKFTESLLYDYYVEIFYYFFYSVRDVLGQLLNVLFYINLEENKIFLNKSFTRRIPNEKIRIIFENFLTKTASSYSTYRNAFNHRFTPTQRDNRAKTTISIKNNEEEIGFGFGKDISKKEFHQDTFKLMQELSQLMEKFDRIINEK